MAFVIRGEGFILESCEIGQEGKEMTYDTREEAERDCELLQEGFPHRGVKLEVVEI
ncbi:hypothetical protein [Bacillus sp. AFS075034]|uniref:hypothetical protein n=1 Tax=Bacillus sp. AFS075034 TaxID=2034281 RepID=UPI00159BDFE8|nr:hypothetical protein [Bacillus sp. AFS075034]